MNHKLTDTRNGAGGILRPQISSSHNIVSARSPSTLQQLAYRQLGLSFAVVTHSLNIIPFILPLSYSFIEIFQNYGGKKEWINTITQQQNQKSQNGKQQ